jgi:hypothetical protein
MIRLRQLAPLLLLAAAPAPAQAADTVLASAASTAGITAYGGQVVLSRRDPATNRWALVRWHAGVVDVLGVPQRGVPFDVDAGTGRNGEPVVVYSRCAREPASLSSSPSGEDFGAAPAPDWQTARGCDLYELALTGESVERKLTAASSKTLSETTPSIWRGGLAFARHEDGGAGAKLLYLPAGATKPRALGGGSVQSCTTLCSALRTHAGVDQLDVGPSRAVYLWRISGGDVSGTGIGWELRAVSLKGGRSTLLSTGQISGACGFHLPSGPTATTRDGLVSYVDAGSDCGPTTTQFATIDPVTGALGSAATRGGLAVAAVRDGATIYWLRSRGPASDIPVPGVSSCSIAAAACELVASPVPTYDALPSRLQGSPARVDLVRSGLGYRWVRGPAGTQLLRPPATVPCAISSQSAYVFTAARWRRGSHSVAVLRRDAGKTARPIRTPQTRSSPKVVDTASTRLVRCGDETSLTYAVTTRGETQRVTFAVARAARPAT